MSVDVDTSSNGLNRSEFTFNPAVGIDYAATESNHS